VSGTPPGPAPRLVGLTYEQAMYFDRLLPSELAVAALRVRGRLELGAVEAALGQVARRHDALRARVQRRGATVTQHVAPPVDRFPLVIQPASSLPELQAGGVVPGDPPDLASDGPLRAGWHPLGPDDGVLVLEVSHPWADAWSVELVVLDLWQAYGRVVRAEPPVPVARHGLTSRLAAQAALPETPEDRLVQVWGDRIRAGAVGERPPPGPTDPVGADVVVDRWDDELLDRARRLAAANRATVSMAAFAACALAVARVLDRPEVLLLCSTMTRGGRGTEAADEVGFCQSLAPTSVPLDPGATVGQLVAAARRQLTQLMLHARPPYAFTSMLRALAGQGIAPAGRVLERWRTGRPGRSPFLAYFNPVRTARGVTGARGLAAPGLQVERIDLRPSYSPCHVFDLMFAPRLDADRPELRVYFGPPSLSRAAVREMAAVSRAFLAADSETPSARVLPVRSPAR
jgi:hypothetical protein